MNGTDTKQIISIPATRDELNRINAKVYRRKESNFISRATESDLSSFRVSPRTHLSLIQRQKAGKSGKTMWIIMMWHKMNETLSKENVKPFGCGFLSVFFFIGVVFWALVAIGIIWLIKYL